MAHFVLALLGQHRHGRLLLFTALLACVGGSDHGGSCEGLTKTPHDQATCISISFWHRILYKISHCVSCRFAYLMTPLRWGRMRGSQHLMAAGTSYIQWPRCDEVAWGSHNTLWQRGWLWRGYATCMTLVGTPPGGGGADLRASHRPHGPRARAIDDCECVFMPMYIIWWSVLIIASDRPDVTGAPRSWEVAWGSHSPPRPWCPTTIFYRLHNCIWLSCCHIFYCACDLIWQHGGSDHGGLTNIPRDWSAHQTIFDINVVYVFK